MKIAVGSANKWKIEAVRLALANYPEYQNAETIGVEADSGVSSQPVWFEEIILGAQNRAKFAFEQSGADLAVGLESGLLAVPSTKSGYMDTTACAIYDGERFYLGFSSCFEYPKAMVEKILSEGKEVSDVAVEMGFAEDRNFREGSGMIGVLTRGVITRIKYSEQAVHTALLQLINPRHY